jgi:hypothetical protein
MIKNIKRMALLFVAAAALLNVACKKDDNDTKNLVGTSWKFYYEGDVQGMEIVMSDELQIFSADSLNRVVYFEMAGNSRDETNTVHYTWDGTTLSIPDMQFAVTYRASDNVLVRPTDDPESVQIMAMLGLDEFLYHQL